MKIAPRFWKHKKTKNILRVMPWFECEDPVVSNVDAPNLMPDRQFKIGLIIQIGWLLENTHGVWLGCGLKAAEEFKDLGTRKPKEWKPK